MKTLRLPILAVVLWATFGLWNYQGLAQTQPGSPAVTATAPTSSPRTAGPRSPAINGIAPIQPATPHIQPVNPQPALSNQTNQSGTGATGSSLRPITTFPNQSQRGSGAAQATSGNANGNQPNIAQPTQQTVSPARGQFRGPVGTTFVPGILAPGIGFDVTNGGIIVNTLEPTGVFFRSGLRQGDVLVSSYGQPILNEADFLRLATQYPEQPMPVLVLRDGQQQTINVLPKDIVLSSPRSPDVPLPGTESHAHLGVRFDLRFPNAAVVTSVRPHSPAETAGLRLGDTITSLNGEPVRSYQQAMEILSSMRPGERVDIGYSRRVDNQTSAVLDSRPDAAMRTASFPPSVRVEGNTGPSVPQVLDGQASPRRLSE